MPPTLFDSDLRALRRDRAAMKGVETFLYDRAFEDIGERLASVQRDFRDILLVGCPNPQWAGWLRMRGGEGTLRIAEPGALLAAAAGGRHEREDQLDIEPQSVDLVIALGSLESANNLEDALLRMRLALRPGGLLIGAMAGGDSLRALRGAMAAADQLRGATSAHVHPRIDPAGLTQLLTNIGLNMPVVDVDRVTARYPSLAKLVDDLRAMGATNILNARDRRYLGKAAYDAARGHLGNQVDESGKFSETFDILHFTGWAPA
ncbi:class I SAM-dependent methyltransferase [Sphingomicrobium flavum]|uniref:class I SAM-dependent methyltransferase n=1 Tax=Sphingomicrobium flavum TaxID=1229164 RepID=UPI0021ADBD96|nr:class I SAM-dependent methyltransferase [Sphingomicrobium flavum]